MRRALPFSLFLPLILIVFNAQAQKDRFAYAITDLSKDGAGWNALRKLDLQTGEYSDVLINGIDQKLSVFNAATKKQLALQPDAKFGAVVNMPFATGVAAAAYDKKHNRLYFTPMFVDQLRYVDLKSMKVFYVTDQPFTKNGTMVNDEAKVITRMVIAPDGYGYAISNDGNTFIRFSTSKPSEIEQLGSLVDDPANDHTSIHNSCSSFGGDMVSDDQGNLYILSARNQVFKVNTETKVATYLGGIKNLTGDFTVNGAVVDGDGKLLVSSAVNNKSYFIINPKDWTASPYQLPNGVFRSSDLANSNYLSTKATTTIQPAQEITTLSRPQEKFANQISVYPNPITNNYITLQFHKVPNGDYTVELTDVLGRSVQQRKITINAEQQTQTLPLNAGNAKGNYLIKVINRDKQSVFTQKVLVQ